MKHPMEGCFGQQGWREFHRNRKNILDEFDKIYEQTINRPVRTAHGIGVEAYIRKWLSEFLPKKYGVTSGYIIPTLYNDSGKLYHYDIIVYDRLNAPILWTEGSQDDSEQGKFRAIPAKYVASVFEVKSRLTKSNADETIEKLKKISEFKTELMGTFACWAIFIDLKESENEDVEILESISKSTEVPGFAGGVVLRYERDTTATGLIRLHPADKDSDKDNANVKLLAKPIDELNILMTEDGKIEISERFGGVMAVATSENSWSMAKMFGPMYLSNGKIVELSWSRNSFSTFCVDLIGTLEGQPFNDKNKLSFGMVFDSFQRKPTEPQASHAIAGMPFLKLSLVEFNNGSNTKITTVGETIEINICLKIENLGSLDVVFSDDYFKSKCALQRGGAAIKPLKYQVSKLSKDDDLSRRLSKDGVLVKHRISFHPTNDNKKFYSLEQKIRLKSDTALLSDS